MSGTLQSTMIRASAGSGKTFQLANRYLALMALGFAPERIIALTFTRKAAGEFTSRIMTRLAAGAENDAAAAELAGQLGEIIKGTDTIPPLVLGEGVIPPVMDAAFFQDQLKQLIEALDRLALSTLDSYFVRIVRNFHLELGLSGFELMEDSAISAERLGVMKVIFSSRRTSKQDRDAFIQSFKQATWGEEENRLCRTLEEFVNQHQNRWLSAPGQECWGGVEKLWPKGCPYPEGGSYAKRAKRVRDLLGTIDNAHGSYLNSWKKACDWMQQRVAGQPVGSVPQRISDAIASWEAFKAGSYRTVFSRREQVIQGELAEAIAELVGAFIRDEIEIRMRRTQGLHAVISAYEQRYREFVRGRGRLCFSDLTLLLAGQGAMQIWAEDERNLIDFRLDARYDHWLLDEFQDTSQPQWQAIANLVDEIIQDAGGERSVFVVGDSKQSIYGWRGGEPRLFDDLKEVYGERLASWDMDRSYRSPQPVLDLVNTVCDLSGPGWREIFPAAALGRWDYHEHTPNQDRPGHALVLETGVDPREADSEEKTEARYACMKALIEKIRPLEQGMTCAILVSKNAHVNAIVQYLRRELPDVGVASDSENKLADGPVGAVILDLFRWLRNPAHHFARIHVSLSPLAEVIEAWCRSDNAQQQWHWLTGEVARTGVAALLGRFVSALREKRDISAYGNSRLDEMLTAAADFSVRGGSLDDWVLMLESRTLRETSHSGLIQVMTIHKCKGLGFDVVILPELGGADFTAAGRLDLLEQKGKLGVTEYVIKKPASEICAADAKLSEMLEAWEAEQCYERFCNLYVALTRAQQATYCILDPVRDQWEPRRKYDDWIREATSACQGGEILLAAESYPVLYQSGDWLEPRAGGNGKAGHEQQPPPAKPLPVALQPATPRLASKLASEAKSYQPGALLNKSKALRFGEIVHTLFEGISWLDDLPELPDTAAGRVVAACLEQAEIRIHFERPHGEFQLLREQPVETMEQGQWISGVIDRAVIMLEKGRPASVSIIDFKTDRDETAASLRKKYASQLEIYRTAMHHVTGVPRERISCHLLATALGKMIDV